MRAYVTTTAALAFVAAACSDRETSDRAESAAVADSLVSAPAWAVPPKFDYLSCAPSVLRKGDVLTMRMTRPHGPNFHAIAPDGTPYIIVFHGEGSPDRAQRKTLIPPDSFADVTEVYLDPGAFTAGVWVSGRDTNELLFRKPGTYRLVVGSDLETDGPEYAECRVRYAP